jgi:hypothetical protein
MQEACVAKATSHSWVSRLLFARLRQDMRKSCRTLSPSARGQIGSPALPVKNPTHSLSSQNQGETPFVLLALLLLALPLVFTLQKFVVLLAFGDPSHQLLAEHPKFTERARLLFYILLFNFFVNFII